LHILAHVLSAAVSWPQPEFGSVLGCGLLGLRLGSLGVTLDSGLVGCGRSVRFLGVIGDVGRVDMGGVRAIEREALELAANRA
jgi:hypothetical protein